jgi:acyl carrier protein
LAERLRGAPERERRRLLTRWMQDAVADLAGLAERPSPRAGLFDLGIDSLHALNLKKRLEEVSGLELPDTLALDWPSIEMIVNLVVVQTRQDP